MSSPEERWLIFGTVAERTAALSVLDGAVCVVTADSSLSLFRQGQGWLPMTSEPTPPVSDIIPADRLTLWNPGLNPVGGIPNVTLNAGTLSPSGGDDRALIQAVIDTAHNAWLIDGILRVVKLNAGTFQIGIGTNGDPPVIVKSGVVLRGAGTALTLLTKLNTGTLFPVITIGFQFAKYTVGVPLAADGVRTALSLELTSTTIGGHVLVAGDLIAVNQKPDPDFVNWGIHVGPPGDGTRGWFNELDRPLGQILEVVSVVGNTVTFNTPLRHDYSLAWEAHVVMWSQTIQGPADFPITQWAGIEDLTGEFGDGGDGGGGIRIANSKYCWIKNIENRYSIGHNVNIDASFRCEVRDSFLHTTLDPNPGGAGYGTGCNGYASDNLWENNIIWNFNKMTVCRASGGGNVWGYNYMDDGFGAGYRDIVEIGCGPNHYACAHHELFEGNRGFNYATEMFWGNSIYATVYRNHFTALRRNDAHLQLAPTNLPSPGLLDAHARHAVGLQAGSWWHSFVGNVLGESGQLLLSGLDFEGNTYDQTAFVYESDPNNVGSEVTVPMWRIGFNGDTHSATADAVTLARIYRHGNFDYVTDDIVWDPSVDNHTLPASLYLSSKPAFMGSKAWPWVSPETPSTPLADTLPAYDRFLAWTAI